MIRPHLLGAALGALFVFASACSGDDQNPATASCDSEPVVMTTADGVAFVRTPDACFASLVDWPYAPHYVEIDGLRQGYVDEGPADGPVVLLLHGQPSWSYLYRKMIPVLVDAGYRVIAMDHLGMGRSDKPTDIASFSYLGHVDRLERFIGALQLTDINLFVQDWGSLIGLQVAGLHPEWFARVAVGDGMLPVIPEGVQPFPPVEDPNVEVDLELSFAAIPAQQPTFYDGCELLFEPESDGGFGNWMIYAMKASGFMPSEVIEGLTWFDLPPDEEAAYDAPFPSRAYMAGPRVFPSLVNELPGVTQEAWEGLVAFDKPFLTLWAANDPGNLGQCATQEYLVTSVAGAAGQPHARLPGASHFLQDDQGPEIARRLVHFFSSDPVGFSLFNLRYCEVLLVDVQGDNTTISVYNTVGLNECPAELWEMLDTTTIAQAEGVTASLLNGPRHWTVDSALPGQMISDEVKDFGGIEMRLGGEIEVMSSELPGGNGPYTEVAVNRDNTWIFYAGREVYELVAPGGDTYVMQSYSQQIDPTLIRWELAMLGERLQLPEGWSFQARALTSELQVEANGQAIVIQDELGNTYQKH